MEEIAAAEAAAYQIARDYPEADPLVAATAAHSAALLASKGAEAGVAAAAGVRAAMAMMRGTPLEQVHSLAAATADAVAEEAHDMEVAAANGIPGSGAAALSKGVPGWSLESWIGSLSFDKVVADALTSRLEKAMEEAGITGGLGDTASQEAFLRSLAINGGVDVILALLKETPVLKRMAEAICDNATELQRLKDEQEQAALFEQTEEVEGGELSPQTYADEAMRPTRPYSQRARASALKGH